MDTVVYAMKWIVMMLLTLAYELIMMPLRITEHLIASVTNQSKWMSEERKWNKYQKVLKQAKHTGYKT